MARISKMQQEMLNKTTEVPNSDLHAIINKLIERVDALEKSLIKVPKASAINRLELGETEPVLFEERAMAMKYEDKIGSMTNAVKILPPNMLVDGRHTAENVGAICGFIVSDEMMDDVYTNFKHDEE